PRGRRPAPSAAPACAGRRNRVQVVPIATGFSSPPIVSGGFPGVAQPARCAIDIVSLPPGWPPEPQGRRPRAPSEATSAISGRTPMGPDRCRTEFTPFCECFRRAVGSPYEQSERGETRKGFLGHLRKAMGVGGGAGECE